MTTNPYAPPSAALTDQPKPAMSPWKAVLLGLAIDVGGSLLVGVLIGVAYGIYLSNSGLSPEQITTAMSELSPLSLVSMVGILSGGAMSFIGGMVCTRAARRSNYSLGLVLAPLSAATAFLLSINQYTLTMNLVLTLLTFATVLLGTKFGQVKTAA